MHTWLPTTRPKLANKNQHNIYPDLTVDSLINSASRTWNSQTIRYLVDPQDSKITEIIPLNMTQMEDRDVYHFTNNEKYTVKSGNHVERVYPDKKKIF